MRGKISHFNDERGYGFISVLGSRDYYFRITDAFSSEKEIEIGDDVDFTGQIVSGKNRASEVRLCLTIATSPTPKDKKPRARTMSYTPDYRGEYTALKNDELSSCLREISNWKLEAKLEDNIRYFLPVPEVGAIRTGNRSYIIGRKGTGKTAIASHLTDSSKVGQQVEKLSFKNFPFNELYKLENSSYTKPNQYITLWKYIIYSTAVRMMASSTSIDLSIRKKFSKFIRNTIPWT